MEQEYEVQRLNRRQFLIRLGAASATITVAGAGISALLNSRFETRPGALNTAGSTQAQPARVFPNSDDPVEPAPGTRPEFTPVEQHYRIDISPAPPTIDGDTWTLSISGLVDNPIELTLDNLRNDFEPVDQYITMECISNPVAGDLISTQLWTGASFRDVLALARPQPEATHARIIGADGFDETVALDLINSDPNVVPCYAWDGQPLPVQNGFPLRVHIPNRFGMKQPKWITSIELISGDEDGYWVRRGWSKDAIIKATAVIDTIATNMITVDEETGQQFVPIGGIAFAGPRGVSRVEVRVDGGEWQEAMLRGPLSGDPKNYKTWRIWRYDWPFTEGQHSFTVRMFEEDGTPQEEQVNGTRPDGATGYHSRGVWR